MATKHPGALYNRDEYDLLANMTWCMMGDACLQEGVVLEAIQLAGHWQMPRACQDQPSFINVRTIIGSGSVLAGQARAHGAPLGKEGVASLKQSLGMDPKEQCKVDPDIYDFSQDAIAKAAVIT